MAAPGGGPTITSIFQQLVHFAESCIERASDTTRAAVRDIDSTGDGAINRLKRIMLQSSSPPPQSFTERFVNGVNKFVGIDIMRADELEVLLFLLTMTGVAGLTLIGYNRLHGIESGYAYAENMLVVMTPNLTHASELGRQVHTAFSVGNRAMGLTVSSFNVDSATHMAKTMLDFQASGKATISCYVDTHGRIVASAFALHFDEIVALGPFSILPQYSRRSQMRLLVGRLIRSLKLRGFNRFRLVQVQNNLPAFALYCKLGFTPLVSLARFVLNGRSTSSSLPKFCSDNLSIRAAKPEDAAGIDLILQRSAGFSRSTFWDQRLSLANEHFIVAVDRSSGNIVGFHTGIDVNDCLAADSYEVAQALLEASDQWIILVPHTAKHLIDYCLRIGACLELQLCYMGIDPAQQSPYPLSGVYLPSITI